MCYELCINRGEVEISTPKQFKEHFGFDPERVDPTLPMREDECLCQIDMERTLKEHGIKFRCIDGDYFVGRLDELSPFTD